MTKSSIFEQIRKRIQDPKNACSMGSSDRFRVFPVTTEATIQAVEQQLNFPYVGYSEELILEAISLEEWFVDWLNGVDLFVKADDGKASWN